MYHKKMIHTQKCGVLIKYKAMYSKIYTIGINIFMYHNKFIGTVILLDTSAWQLDCRSSHFILFEDFAEAPSTSFSSFMCTVHPSSA